MAYRSGTYVAFDGQGEPCPANSDYKYFNTLKMWQKSNSCDFNFVNSHEKTYAVRDTSCDITLRNRLRERMRNSKNMLVIISNETNYNRGLLNWEIETAVNDYNLPIIVAYTGETNFSYLTERLIQRLPKNLKEYVVNNTAKVAHIPFTQDKIKYAIAYYGVNSNVPYNSKTVY